MNNAVVYKMENKSHDTIKWCFLNIIHNHISVYIHAYLIIFCFITEYSAMHGLPLCEPWNSLTAVPDTSSWQPTTVVQETLTLSATGSYGFMYFICSVYTVWHYKISNKIKKKAETQIMNVNWLVSIFKIIKSSLFCTLL